jgi:hypothetical protein
MSIAATLRDREPLETCPSCGTAQYLVSHDPDQCATNLMPDDVAFDLAIDAMIERARDERRGI